MSKILLAEDEELIATTITDALNFTSGLYTLEHVTSGKEALFRMQTYEYDLAILDWGLPELTGVEVCCQYRQNNGKVPILMLTGKGEDTDKEFGLDAGADDYLTKPFSMKELLARIRALLRRSPILVPSEIKIADLSLNTTTGQVTRAGVEVHLLPKELAVLQFLAKNKNQIVDVDALLNSVWSSESEASEDAVRQTIARLRRKIESVTGESAIKTVKGYGYVIEDRS